MNFRLSMALAIITVIAAAVIFSTFERPPVDVVQRGYRGLGMVELANRRLAAPLVTANQVPDVADKQDPSGQPASAAYQNVQVLKDLDSNELLRLMTDITAWVAPEQGCTYCHAEGEDLSSDKLYTKVVARRMIEMVRHINGGWKDHVKETGVTCYTCHRGQPVPSNVWFNAPAPPHAMSTMVQDKAGQNTPTATAGFTALPYDPLTPFLEYAKDIRVIGGQALPGTNRKSIKQTEWTYALMINMSKALGVNCTFCHNTRSFFAWDQSTPQRVTAFHGIRMVRDLNISYMQPLKGKFPHERLGPLGDVAKIDCATCHQGVYKPLLGVSMLSTYPELASEGPIAPATPASAPAAAPNPPTTAPAPSTAPPAPAR